MKNHQKHVKLVLQRTCEHKLYVKLPECKFEVQEVEYLGFVLKAQKLAMNPNKMKAIEVWEKPTTKKELQRVLGLAKYYRQFIRNCSKILKLLTKLTENVTFNWLESAQKAFNELKETVTTAPVLTQFDPERKIYVTTDACKFDIGAVMGQDHDHGRHTVTFIS